MLSFPIKKRSLAATAAGLTLVALISATVAQPASAARGEQAQALRLKSWGLNGSGQLGDGTTTDRHTPVTAAGETGADAIQVSGGGFHSLALLNNGTIEAWGTNAEGQLGDGTTTDHSTPGTVAGLLSVRAISAGRSHSLALLSNGTVMAWGDNTFGQLGNGTVGPDNPLPAPVTGLTGVVAIAAGNFHSLALLSDGTVRAWGLNSSGQLGNGTIVDSPVPVTVLGLTGAKAIAAGGSHSLALLNNGTARAWGLNTDGQLGNGTMTSSSIPVTVLGLTGAGALAGGFAHSLALLTNGTVRAWGDNIDGQIGDGTTTDRLAPVAVLGLTGVSLIAAGGNHSMAYPSLGPVTNWGANNAGQIGDGTTTMRTVPTGIRTGRIGITSISAGFAHSLIV